MLVFTTHSSGLIGLIWIFLFFQNAFSIHPVTGRTGHGVHPRLEIRELAKDRDQFNLYLLGLQRFQAMDQNDMLSYYQIAGIHGRPYKEYDGVPGVHSSGGYCPHVSNMFMPWHRPFLALFEEALLRKVDEIVDQFPAGATRNRYRSAADKLRVPFWDWAMNAPQGENVVPRQLTDEFVSVTSPNGDQTISNPLYSYKFNPLNTNDMGGYPYTVWQNTLRRPTSRDGNAKSNTQQFVSMMDSNQKSLHDRMYGLFTRAAPFVEVSTECVGNGCGNDVSHDSFESVHDVIHIISGGNTGGHMYLLDFSAFDPVFWLHHANVDRAMALFNFLYPDTYVEPGRQTQDNFQWSRGQVKNAWTPLKPFHSNSNGDFWMAKDIKDPSVFGYTYPELTNGATTSSVRSAINRLYQPQSSSSSRRRSLFPGNSTVSVYTNGTGSDREYMLNVVGEKFALGGSYAIYFFLGECDLEDMSSWGDCPGFVGANGVLAPSGGVTMNGTTVTGLVPITSALHDLHLGGYLDSLDEDVVEAFLSLRLHWVVVKEGGETLTGDRVPGLEIAASSQGYTPAAGEHEFPVWDNTPVVHINATIGKPGGYNGNTSSGSYFQGAPGFRPGSGAPNAPADDGPSEYGMATMTVPLYPSSTSTSSSPDHHNSTGPYVPSGTGSIFTSSPSSPAFTGGSSRNFACGGSYAALFGGIMAFVW